MIAILLSLFMAYQTPPSVLVIMSDDLGWTETSLMPEVGELANQGVMFTRAYSWPVCSSTRLAAMFGRYPRRNGIGAIELDPNVIADDRLPLSLFSTAELFKAGGYATATTGKWHLGRAPLFGEMDSVTSGPYCQGWDAWPAGNPASLGAGAATGYYSWAKVVDGSLTISTQYASDGQRIDFLAWWNATPGQKLGWLCFNAPHQTELGFEPPPGMSPTGTVRGDYEQIVTNLDAQIGLVLDQISLSDTFVIFLSDNGTPDPARPIGTPSGFWKTTTYEGGVHVPMVVAGPGVSSGVSTSRLVSVVDIGSTIAELVGIDVPAGFDDSQSFANELGSWSGTAQRSFVFTEIYNSNYDDQAVIESQWKLRRWGTPGGTFQDRAYHLPTDPWEQAPIDPVFLPASLRNRLYAELASIPPRAP